MTTMEPKQKSLYNKYRSDIMNLLILVLVATGLGVYLVATTVVISKDGVVYIELAKDFFNGAAPLRHRRFFRISISHFFGPSTNHII